MNISHSKFLADHASTDFDHTRKPPKVLKRARMSKQLKAALKAKAAATRDQNIAKSAWNSTRTNFGEKVSDGQTIKHKTQFDPHGALKLAFSNSLDSRLATKSYLEARAMVVHALLASQASSVASLLDNTAARSKYLFLERSWDDTPIHVSFGQLAEQIAPFAKYVVPGLHRAGVGRSLVSYDDCMSRGIPMAQHGIADVFAEHVVMESSPGEAVKVLVPIRIMLGKTAGHIFNALQTTLRSSWSHDSLSQLDRELILVVDSADSASANRKAVMYFGKHAPENALCFGNRCSVHQLQRCLFAVLERLKMTSNMVCLTNTLVVSGRQNQFRKAIATIVAGDLETNYFGGLEPPAIDAPHRQHSRNLVDKLLLERSWRRDYSSPLASSSDGEVRRRADMLCDLLQSPWTGQKARFA